MLVNNQINGWMGRVATKMAELTDDFEGASRVQGNSMVDQYRYIANKVSDMLDQIKYKKKDDEINLHGSDYIHQFVEKDYITKNIRVIANNGVNENQSEHTSKHIHGSPGRGGGGDESEVEDMKVNYEIYHELMDARSLVKEKKIEEERKAKELAEKLAKKNKK